MIVNEKNNLVKEMANLLRAGARMLSETCPKCNSPLFQLRSGEVVCPKHGRVLIVKSESEVITASTSAILDNLEAAVIKIINDLTKHLTSMEASELTVEDARNIIAWLEALERIRRVKVMLSSKVRK